MNCSMKTIDSFKDNFFCMTLIYELKQLFCNLLIVNYCLYNNRKYLYIEDIFSFLYLL
jgi:hypothetical protein